MRENGATWKLNNNTIYSTNHIFCRTARYRNGTLAKPRFHLTPSLVCDRSRLNSRTCLSVYCDMSIGSFFAATRLQFVCGIQRTGHRLQGLNRTHCMYRSNNFGRHCCRPIQFERAAKLKWIRKICSINRLFVHGFHIFRRLHGTQILTDNLLTIPIEGTNENGLFSIWLSPAVRLTLL